VHAIAEVPLAELGTEPHDFDVVFRDASPGVFRTLYAYTGGRRDVAEEAMAEAFARALARSGSIRDPVAWIYRTAFRLANRSCGGSVDAALHRRVGRCRRPSSRG
jgi:predicted RNA polymerase sigma factor